MTAIYFFTVFFKSNYKISMAVVITFHFRMLLTTVMLDSGVQKKENYQIIQISSILDINP